MEALIEYYVEHGFAESEAQRIAYEVLNGNEEEN